MTALIAASPSAAIDAYRAAGKIQDSSDGQDGAGFGSMLSRAIGGAIDAGRQADAKSMQAIAGTGSITDVVSAVSRAELALQTTAAIRDRMVQAYQDIMRMPI